MNLFFDNRVSWAEAVNSGRKVHTVRRVAKRVRPGVTLAMITGRYTGRVEFARKVCAAVQPVTISGGSVAVGDTSVDPETFARNSGFNNAPDMFAYYGDASVVLIHWTNLRY